MSIDSRLHNLEGRLAGRERALLWLKTAQEKGGYLDFGKNADLDPWVAQSDEGGQLYCMVFDINGTVLLEAGGWLVLGTWASLLGLSLPGAKLAPEWKPCELCTIEDVVKLWRERLCAFLTEVLALESAVRSISNRYFEGHDVLFSDSRKMLQTSHENVMTLVLSYNYSAEEIGAEPIDIGTVESRARPMAERRAKMFVGLASAQILARHRMFGPNGAIEELLRLLEDHKSSDKVFAETVQST